ncbi:MAG: ABC transporter ATP-binding protein [Clostridia bacterium]|nr:ABC transporter ATP-binding protein [Clostridia bacterium]
MSEERNKSEQGNHNGGGMFGPVMPAKPKDFKAGIGKLLKYLKSELPRIIIAVILTIFVAVLSIWSPSFVSNLTNELFVSVLGFPINMAEVARLGIILIIIYACTFVLQFAGNFIMANVNQRIAKKLRTQISKKINVVPLKYYDSDSFGNVLSRVTNDVDTIGQSLNQSVSSLIYSVVCLIGVLIVMFLTSWQLALTALATVPVGMIIIVIIMKFSQKHFSAQQKQLGELNGIIEENYSGQTVVKAFNGEEKALSTFEATNKKLFKSSKNSQFLSGLMMPIIFLIANLGYIAICVVGGILFADNLITIGVITAFFIYVRLFQNAMGQLAQIAAVLQSTAAASERVFEFLCEEEQEDESLKTVKIETIAGKVEFDNVSFGYSDDKTVINNFSACIEPGQKVAIVGPTGAGKTTLINLLMRFYELKSGQTLIDGVPINEMKREDVRALFGIVLQDTWLFEGTIKENIAFSKENVTIDEVVKACESANIDHFIRTLPDGYNMQLTDEVSISGGQRQLLTIARAMIQNCPMLILDEATSNVDTRTEHLIQDAMDKITKGRTSFVIAHRLSTIKNADLILVIDNGDIVESGTHNELIEKKNFYYNLYNSQFSLSGENS